MSGSFLGLNFTGQGQPGKGGFDPDPGFLHPLVQTLALLLALAQFGLQATIVIGQPFHDPEQAFDAHAKGVDVLFHHCPSVLRRAAVLQWFRDVMPGSWPG
ncbi:MAG: hypothetical protein R3E68_10625 [Burkholderiaceae bacterium]